MKHFLFEKTAYTQIMVIPIWIFGMHFLEIGKVNLGPQGKQLLVFAANEMKHFLKGSSLLASLSPCSALFFFKMRIYLKDMSVCFFSAPSTRM